MWRLVYNNVSDVSEGIIDPFYNHIKRLIGATTENLIEYNYIVNCLSQIVQFPNERIVGTCLVLVSEVQGTGKSIFSNIIFSVTL